MRTRLAAFGATLTLASVVLIAAGFGNEWIVAEALSGALMVTVAFLLWVGEG